MSDHENSMPIPTRRQIMMLLEETGGDAASLDPSLVKKLIQEAFARWGNDLQVNKWRAVLDDALVCAHILSKQNENDPKQALNDLIRLEVAVATDPRVSKIALQEPRHFSKEPPTADDADDNGIVWAFDSHGRWHRTSWRLVGRFGNDYWLPLWALPLPVPTL